MKENQRVFFISSFKTGGLFQYMVIHMNDKLQSDVFLQLRITSCDILVTMLAHDEAMQLTFNQDSKLFISTFLGKFIYFITMSTKKIGLTHVTAAS